MKKMLYISVFLALIMLILPLSVINDESKIVSTAILSGNQTNTEKILSSTSFKVCNNTTGDIAEIKTEDYIFGVVAAEMPALYEEEA